MNRSTTAQMDILSVLARMSLRLKLGRAARKVLLSALTLHDSRVDAFLIFRTDFFHNLLTELSKQFTVAAEKATDNFATIAIQSLSAVGDAKQIALSPKSFLSRPGFNASAADMRRTFSSSNRMDSLESPANGMLKDRSPFSIVDSKHSLRRGNQQSSSTSKLKDSIEGAVEDSSRSAAGSIEAFRQLLRFFVTVFTHLHSKPWNSKTMDNELELQECSANPHLKPLSLYFSVFLVETLQPLLLAQSQNCNLACNVLLMYLLRDLRDLEGKDTVLSIEVAHSTRNSANKLNCISEQQSLLTTTIIFLCDQTLLSNSSASSLNLQIYKERALISSPIGGPIEQCSDSSSLILQLVERLGSISKSVAASSSQLLSCLLAVAPLSLARQILMTSLENNRQAVQTNHQNNNPSESPISRNKLDFQEESARVVEVKASSSITKESSVVGSSSPNFQNTSGEYSHTTTSEMGYISLDYKLTAVVGKLSVTAFSSLLYCLQTEIAENKELGARTGTSDVDGRVYFQRYEDSAASAILHRLDAVIANVLESGPITMVKSTGDGVNVLPGMVGAEVNIFRGVLLHHESIILRKLLDRLQSLLAMKADEQVMTSLLLRECLSILCAYLVISPNSVDGSKILQPATVDRVISLELEYILTIIAAVETQWQEVIRYAKKIPDVVRKVCAVKHAMLRQAHAVNYSFSNSVDSSASTNSIEKDKNVSSGLDMGSPSPSVRSETVYHKIMGFPFSSKADQTMRKVIENDSAQSITILESLVMIYEIRCEISGYLFAARKLRKKIAESTSGDGLIGGASMTENWWETLEASNRRIFNIHSPLLQEVAGDGRHVIQSKMGPIVSAIQLFSPGKTPAHESFSDIHIRHSEVHGKIEEASTTQSMVTSEEEGYTEVFHAVIEDEQLQDFQETASVLAMLAIRQAPPSSASKIRLDYLSEGQYSDLSKGIFWTGLEESEAEFLAEYDQLEATLRKITDSED